VKKAQIELPPKLVPVFEGEARYRGSWGGRGSGKTRTFALMTAVMGYRWGMAGKKGQILCAREFMNSLDDSSLEEIKTSIRSIDWLNDYYDVGEKYIRSKDGNIHYTFVGLRRSLDAIKSKARIMLAWVDEAEPMSEMAWQKLIPTVREEGSEIWATWNPESKYSATHERFRISPPKNSKIVELNYTDNPWFPSVLENERLEDKEKRPDVYKHIWEGDFLTFSKGAYYAKQLEAAREGGRIGTVPIDPILPVSSFWDLGIADATAIWLVQQAGTEIRVVGYYENSGEGLQHYINWLHDFRDKHSIIFGDHFAPHDIKVRELTTGKTRKDQARQMGIIFRVTPNIPIMDGIEAARRIFPRCYFDEKRCSDGLKALSHYRCEYDEDKRMFKDRPLHNYASHSADAFRYFAVAWRDKREKGLNQQAVMKQEWSVF
jgi:phage terminase large subunit